MKSFFFSILAGAIFSVTALFSSPGKAAGATLCYENENYAPYLIGEQPHPAEPNPGVLVEFIRQTFATLDTPVSFVRHPWKRCVKLVERNEIDGIFGIIYKKDRESLGRFPMRGAQPDRHNRLLTVDYSLFTHRSSPLFWDGKNFTRNDLRIGTPLGYAVSKSLKNTHGITPNERFLPESGLKLVEQHKLDGYIVEKQVGISYIRKNNLEKSVIPRKPAYRRHDLYLMVSHEFYAKQTPLVEEIWSTIGQTRDSVIPVLLEKYLTY